MSDDAAVQKAQTATRFNTMAAEFDAQGAFAHFGRRLVEVVGVETGQRVLDVATGRGAVLFPAAEHVGTTGEAVGVDIAEMFISRIGWLRVIDFATALSCRQLTLSLLRSTAISFDTR